MIDYLLDSVAWATIWFSLGTITGYGINEWKGRK